MSEYYLNVPLDENDITQLSVGDTVYVSGKAFTCRSRLHRWVFDECHSLPKEATKRDVLIHVGPIMIKENDSWRLVSFMPTSSIRFEKWGARSVDRWSLKMIIGKTTMGDETMTMMKKKKCVHVSPQSVSPNLWLHSIEVDGVDLVTELGSIEATWLLTLNKLGPFIVDIDCEGRNLYRERRISVDQKRESALQTLGIEKDFQYTKLY